jgi:hypothetical protein
MVKKLLPITALGYNSLPSPADGKSGAGSLLPGEIPGILKICAYCVLAAITCRAKQNRTLSNRR